MRKSFYNIVMFAHNEEHNITQSVKSVFDNSDDKLEKLVVIANGCTDATVGVLTQLKMSFSTLEVIDLVIGDKCNAWNRYVHEFASDALVHFFVDADVRFTDMAFPQMFQTLIEDNNASAVAGLPFSGRNIGTYKDMVTNGWSLFGNCYGLKLSFIQIIRNKKFKLPIGLGWIDSAITKIIYKDVDHQKKAIKGRIIFNEKCGYQFDSLSLWKKSDWSLYVSRIVRYRLGKLQEKHLEIIPFESWPDNLLEINQLVIEDIKLNKSYFNLLDRYLVVKRVKKFALKMQPK